MPGRVSSAIAGAVDPTSAGEILLRSMSGEDRNSYYHHFYDGLNVHTSLFTFHGGTVAHSIYKPELSLLTVDVLRGFVLKYLLNGYDLAVPIPDFHEMMWRIVLSQYPFIAIASPRGSAKTTAITHAYGLASLLFRESDYALLISDTETQAIMYLEEIKHELTENEALKKDFGIERLEVDSQTLIVCNFSDGHRFRVQVRGAEQKVRGLKWRSRRPNLLLVDDAENDELVESEIRREKMRRWFFNALLPACSERVRIRVAGTVLHFDALLYRLLNDDGWFSCIFRSSESPTSFEHVLWPDKFPEARLSEKKESYKRQNNLGGFSQEYYNEPILEEDAFFMREDFHYLDDNEEFPEELTYYAGWDFAISKDKQSAYTCCGVIGVDGDGYWYVVHVRRGHWNAYEIMHNIFEVHLTYRPELMAVEKGQIWDTLEPIFNTECRDQRIFPRLFPVQAIKDKKSRARAFQFKMKAGNVIWDRRLDWFDACFLELIRFDRGPTKDQVDALSWAARMIEDMFSLPQIKEKEEEEEERETYAVIGDIRDRTRNQFTGY